MEEVNFDMKSMELGKVLIVGQRQLMGCPTRILGHCRAIEIAGEKQLPSFSDSPEQPHLIPQ